MSKILGKTFVHVEKWLIFFQEDLEADPVVAGRPIILQSRDGHALWVSQRTLAENAPFPDTIEGGVIMRDKTGNPTGAVHLPKIIISPLLISW